LIIRLKNKEITFLIDQDTKDYTGLKYSYMRAFESLGYDCHIVAFNVSRYMGTAVKVHPAVETKYLEFKQRQLIQEMNKFNSDLLFVIKGYFLLPETIEKLRLAKINRKIICFNPDDPFSDIRGSSSKAIKDSIGHYDAYFIWHRALINRIREQGCKHVFYLPFAADLGIMDRENGHETREKYAVSFIGNSDKERRELINEIALNLGDFNERKAVFGYGWNNIDGFESHGQVLGQEYMSTMYESAINLNILRKQNKNSNNMRTFEIPAAGKFLLHEYSDEVVDFFKEGEEAEFFRSAGECAEKIKYYTKNSTVRQKIAAAGHQRLISSGYTYTNLARNINESLQSIE